MREGDTADERLHTRSKQQRDGDRLKALEDHCDALEAKLRILNARERATNAQLNGANQLDMELCRREFDQKIERLRAAFQRQYDIMAAEIAALRKINQDALR